MDNSIFKLEYDGLSRFALASGCRDRERNSEKEQGACDALIEPGSNGLAYDPVDGACSCVSMARAASLDWRRTGPTLP